MSAGWKREGNESAYRGLLLLLLLLLLALETLVPLDILDVIHREAVFIHVRVESADALLFRLRALVVYTIAPRQTACDERDAQGALAARCVNTPRRRPPLRSPSHQASLRRHCR